MGDNLLLNGVYWGYNPLIRSPLILTSCPGHPEFRDYSSPQTSVSRADLPNKSPSQYAGGTVVMGSLHRGPGNFFGESRGGGGNLGGNGMHPLGSCIFN